MLSPLEGSSCFMLISGTRAMVVEKRILSTLLHIVIIWCLSVQESVQLDFGNTFEREIAGIDLNNSVSTPKRLQLYSRASMKHVRIMERKIDAMGENGDSYARLIIRTDAFEGRVTIQGYETEYYLCINKKGHVVGRKKIKRSSGVTCVFTEIINNDYTELKPVQQTEMYLGFNKDGRALSAHRTRPGVRAVQFLKRPLPEDTPTDDSSMYKDGSYGLYEFIQQFQSRDDTARENTDS